VTVTRAVSFTIFTFNLAADVGSSLKKLDNSQGEVMTCRLVLRLSS
jgi:hypothetical protein